MIFIKGRLFFGLWVWLPHSPETAGGRRRLSSKLRGEVTGGFFSGDFLRVQVLGLAKRPF